MQAKEQFISNKNLAGWWGQISKDTRFDAVLLHASGMALEGMASQEQRDGCLRFKEILLTMAIPEAEPIGFTTPGIRHNLDETRRTVALKSTEQTKTKKK